MGPNPVNVATDRPKSRESRPERNPKTPSPRRAKPDRTRTSRVATVGRRSRNRCDRVVESNPFNDGFGLMRDAQTAKLHSFRTGDGWFAFNLATNLACM